MFQVNWAKRNVLLTAALLLILSSEYVRLASGCYITNCPWGGKRAVDDNFKGYDTNHQCRSCADGFGTCFGPRICCGEEMGCLIETKESLVCRHEDVKSLTPCTPYGKLCTAVEYGRCATRSLCCSPDYCAPDPTCATESRDASGDDDDSDASSDESTENTKIDKNLLRILSNLIEKRRRHGLTFQGKKTAAHSPDQLTS